MLRKQGYGEKEIIKCEKTALNRLFRGEKKRPKKTKHENLCEY